VQDFRPLAHNQTDFKSFGNDKKSPHQLQKSEVFLHIGQPELLKALPSAITEVAHIEVIDALGSSHQIHQNEHRNC
jgi:hypothetical protein